MFPRLTLIGCVAASLACGMSSCAHTDSRAAEVARGEVTVASSAPDARMLSSTASTSAGGSAAEDVVPPHAAPANELGRIPVFEYHLIADKNSVYERKYDGLRRDLELMYERGYRPVSVAEMVDRKIDLPAGLSPVVIVFDDASPSQFRYIEKNGQLEIDPTSAVGILMAFNRAHPDWRNRAVFCMLPAAQAGRAFFGDKGIEGQKTEWRFKKVQFLAEQGFELCNHTLYHARLDRAGAKVEEFIARGQMAIDSAVPGYKVRTMALPLGMWPQNHELARRGTWRDARGGVVSYSHDAILEVTGGPSRSPFDPQFNPLSIPRVQVIGDSAVARTLNALEKHGQRYVSDGDPRAVARPRTAAAGE